MRLALTTLAVVAATILAILLTGHPLLWIGAVSVVAVVFLASTKPWSSPTGSENNKPSS